MSYRKMLLRRHLIGLLAMACVSQSALAQTGSPPVADLTPGEGFDVMRYQLALTPDMGNEAVAGRATIRLRAAANKSPGIAFSGNALAIDSATLDGAPVTSCCRNASGPACQR